MENGDGFCEQPVIIDEAKHSEVEIDEKEAFIKDWNQLTNELANAE
jgi:hypothetical protein